MSGLSVDDSQNSKYRVVSLDEIRASGTQVTQTFHEGDRASILKAVSDSEFDTDSELVSESEVSMLVTLSPTIRLQRGEAIEDCVLDSETLDLINKFVRRNASLQGWSLKKNEISSFAAELVRRSAETVLTGNFEVWLRLLDPKLDLSVNQRPMTIQHTDPEGETGCDAYRKSVFLPLPRTPATLDMVHSLCVQWELPLSSIDQGDRQKLLDGSSAASRLL